MSTTTTPEPSGWVTRPGGIRVYVGAFPELPNKELHEYRYTATPTDERPHRTCGKPSGRSGHAKHGTPLCEACRTAEREYARARRAS